MARFTVPYSKECAYSDRHPDSCNIAHERMALEAKCIRRALRELKSDGWLPVKTSDSGVVVETPTTDTVLGAVFSVDISSVYVTRDNETSWFSVILGNGIDCIPDYGNKLDAPMTRAYRAFEGWE